MDILGSICLSRVFVDLALTKDNKTYNYDIIEGTSCTDYVEGLRL